MKNKIKLKIINSISLKAIIILIALAVINISFFISIVFENQVDLVTENAKYQTEKMVSSLVLSLKKYSSDIRIGEMIGSGKEKEKDVALEIEKLIKPLVDNYIIFTEKGRILIKSDSKIDLPKSHLTDALRSITSQTFSGKEYFLKADEENLKMYFYIPLKEYRLKNSIIFLAYDIRNIQDRLSNLYSQSFIIFIITIIFFLIFAFFLKGLIIKPIQLLSEATQKIAAGNYSARVDLQRSDEIGILAESFNKMSEAVEGNIKQLNKQMNVISQAKEKIEKLAITDELTNLYNRRYLFRRLQDEFEYARKYLQNVGFLMIDIDHFKSLNDSYSHQVGDIILKKVADMIKDACRNSDVVTRYGGDEISVIAPNCSIKDVMSLSEKIRKNIEAMIVKIPGGDLSVTVSIGATSFNHDLVTAFDKSFFMIGFADMALYRAKGKGRNRVEFG